MKRFLFLLALGVIGALLFRAYAFEGIYLASDSMAPTLPVGRHVFVNKFVYRFRKPRRGEIVSFHTPQLGQKGLVKRVIAVAGDTVEIKMKNVFLNGKQLDEPYVQHTQAGTMFVGDNLSPLYIPPGFIFVMGDNRDVSGDSRDWKDKNGTWSPYVPLTLVEGRVLVD